MVNRSMRVIVFFDLPVQTKNQRRQYTAFRKYLVKNGYSMLQYSVYSRTAQNHDDAKKYIEKLRSHTPPQGSIRVMTVTEKQYYSMEVLIGERWKHETMLDSKQVLEL